MMRWPPRTPTSPETLRLSVWRVTPSASGQHVQLQARLNQRRTYDVLSDEESCGRASLSVWRLSALWAQRGSVRSSKRG